jgi:hypothetical protein
MSFVKKLLTPPHILSKSEHDNPYIIFPEDFKSFDELLQCRDDIKELRLVPIKSDEMQIKYHSVDKTDLLSSINFEYEDILFMENQFPYMLPNDLHQMIIWIKQGTTEEKVIQFIEEKITLYGEDVILFERPFNINTKLVKGSFPLVRHIHFWHKLY